MKHNAFDPIGPPPAESAGSGPLVGDWPPDPPEPSPFECGAWSLVQRGTDGVAVFYRIVRLRCKRWDCPVCGPRRVRKLQRLAEAGRPSAMLTLTSNPAMYEHPADAARDLVKAFRLLRRRVKRSRGWKSFPFLAVFERTKSGWPHLHVLLRTPFIPQRVISRIMGELTNAPVVWIERVSDQRRAAGYVAKYLAKSPARFQGCRSYWRSRDWVILSGDDDISSGRILWQKWRLVRSTVYNVADQLAGDAQMMLITGDVIVLICGPP